MNLLNFNKLLCYTSLEVTAPPFWHKLAESTISGSLTLAGICFAAWLAYLFAVRQKKRETFIGLERVKYERKLNALEECWKLLIYTTDTENKKSILTWEQVNDGDKIYYLDMECAREFISNLAGYHYGSGLGIYLPKEIKEKLFEYRNILHGFLLKEKDNTGKKIEILNKEMAARMIQIHQALIQHLKNETALIDKTGLKK